MKNLHEKMKTAQHHVRTQHRSSIGFMAKLLAILVLACSFSVSDSYEVNTNGTHDISMEYNKMFNVTLYPPSKDCDQYSVTLNYAAKPCTPLVIKWTTKDAFGINIDGIFYNAEDKTNNDHVYVFTAAISDSKVLILIGSKTFLEHGCVPDFQPYGQGKWHFNLSYEDTNNKPNCVSKIEVIGGSKYIPPPPTAPTTIAATTTPNKSMATTATTNKGTTPSGSCAPPPLLKEIFWFVIAGLSGGLNLILIVTIIVLIVLYYRSKKSSKKTVKKDVEVGKKKDQKKDATKDQKKAPEKDKKKDSKEDEKPETESEFAARIKKYSDSHGNYDAMADPANKSIFETTSETTSEDSTEESTGSE